ncbi:MAG: gamma-glutamyltransferase [Thermomicrobiales bacterium]
MVRGARALRHDGSGQRVQARHRYCRKRHPLTVHASNIINTYKPWLDRFPSSKEFFFGEGDIRPGRVFKQPDLAKTFRAVVEGGPEAFYTGDVGNLIVDFVQANGGLLTKEDMRDLDVEWVDPIGITYRDFEVFGPPAPSSAVQWLQTLKLMEGFDTQGMGHNSVDYIHTLIECESWRSSTASSTTSIPPSR